jgi:tetratricopeptide (TPR) repeat protein
MYKILFTGLLGTMVTIPLVQTVAAKTSISIGRATSRVTTLIAESNAQNTTQPAVNYLVSALQKYNKQDYRGAVADYDRAILIDPNYAKAYSYRGFVKAGQLQDYRGGLTDLNRAIQLDPKLADAYMNRGQLKEQALHDVRGGLADYNLAIKLNPKFAIAYANRGILKHDLLRDRSGGIADLQQAIRLFQQQGDTENYQVVTEKLKKWQQAGKNSSS